jgi:hypothetical protein
VTNTCANLRARALSRIPGESPRGQYNRLLEEFPSLCHDADHRIDCGCSDRILRGLRGQRHLRAEGHGLGCLVRGGLRRCRNRHDRYRRAWSYCVIQEPAKTANGIMIQGSGSTCQLATMGPADSRPRQGSVRPAGRVGGAHSRVPRSGMGLCTQRGTNGPRWNHGWLYRCAGTRPAISVEQHPWARRYGTKILGEKIGSARKVTTRPAITMRGTGSGHEVLSGSPAGSGEGGLGAQHSTDIGVTAAPPGSIEIACDSCREPQRRVALKEGWMSGTPPTESSTVALIRRGVEAMRPDRRRVLPQRTSERDRYRVHWSRR